MPKSAFVYKFTMRKSKFVNLLSMENLKQTISKLTISHVEGKKCYNFDSSEKQTNFVNSKQNYKMVTRIPKQVRNIVNSGLLYFGMQNIY